MDYKYDQNHESSEYVPSFDQDNISSSKLNKTLKHFWDNNLITFRFEQISPTWFQKFSADNFEQYTKQLQSSNNLYPIPTMNNDGFIMVNTKQAIRIQKRREQKRIYLKQINKIKEKVKHSSRQQHACRRERNKSGRFISKSLK